MLTFEDYSSVSVVKDWHVSVFRLAMKHDKMIGDFDH